MHRDMTERIEHGLGESKAVKGYAAMLKAPLDAIFAKGILRPVKNFLNGTWLEHPLHPTVTDIPIGAWTLALVFDGLALIAGIPNLGIASAIAIGIGALGALASIVTGLMDWMDVSGKDQAVGVIHGSVNIIATIMFGLSFFIRYNGGWEIGGSATALAVAAYLLMAIGGYLGGSLVFRRGVMVNRNAYLPEQEEFVSVMASSALAKHKLTCVEVAGQPVLLWRHEDTISAIGGVCSHLGAPLVEGKVKGGNIVCPWHGSQFALSDGSVRSGPATAPVPAYETRVTNGKVQVKKQ